MKKQWWIGTATALAMLFWVSGCNDENGRTNMTGPGNQATDEEMEAVAEDYGAALAGEGEGMLGMWAEDGGSGPFSGGDREGDRALDDTLIFVHNGFQVVLIRNFFDADGNWSVIYDPLTSVRMERMLTIEGSRTNQSGRRTVTLWHSDQMMIWGIAPTDEVFTLEGSGERNVESEFASRFHQNERTVTAEYDWVVDDLVIHHDRSSNPFPLEGTIAVDVMVTRTHQNPGRDFEATWSTSFVVHFNGTRYAELVFANGAHFWIDLTNGWCHRERP